MARSEERTAVKTYVPAYQKEHWVEQAEELDMGLSEFVRTMVQAGRRGFGGEVESEPDAVEAEVVQSPERSSREETGSVGLPPGGDDLETVILDVLREEPREPPAIVDEVAGDLEDRIFDAIEELEESGTIEHDMRTNTLSVTVDE